MRGEKIRFAIIGLEGNQSHAYFHARMLRNAGAEFVAYYSSNPEPVSGFVSRYASLYPDDRDVRQAKSMEEILEDPTIDVIAGSAIPAERADISIKAMQHGKDVITDKPAVTTFDQLEQVQRVQRETGRIWAFYSNEHHERRCTVLAEELVAQGAIGRVVQTTGLGPHGSGSSRPDWAYEKRLAGGIIEDLGAHQIDQFLSFTGSRTASIVHSVTGNFVHPEHPEYEDYGEASLLGDGGIGWFRVDRYTPRSLRIVGDIRLFVLGTDGYMEMRKYVDPAGRPGPATPPPGETDTRQEHLLLVNSDGPRFLDIEDVQFTFGTRFLNDVRNRTETAIPQERSFLIVRLALEAQMFARHFDVTLKQQAS
jgi:predicted dehydrogenase